MPDGRHPVDNEGRSLGEVGSFAVIPSGMPDGRHPVDNEGRSLGEVGSFAVIPSGMPNGRHPVDNEGVSVQNRVTPKEHLHKNTESLD